MVSSTFKDLQDHREALIRAIQKEAFAAVVMENDTAKPDGDVIESSLQMVREAAAYIVLIGLRYGQTPSCPIRNPKNLSITELEFNEAQRIGRPILLFVMDEDHPVTKADIERDPVKEAQLDAFRERAKKSSPDSLVSRVYDTFNNLEHFKEKVPHAVSGLRRYLEKISALPSPSGALPASGSRDPIPAPPAFYAEPRYGASHRFVGRKSELDILSDWASPADPHPILLFDAIGGSGKSMLTWEWTTNRATQLRGDWAGRLWYSFYERGAIMADFCRHALAYITQEPLDSFKKLKTQELGKHLLHHLQAGPWLMVLDGLERVLVAYNRDDAAVLSDEEASNPTDQIANRDPCKAIRTEDDDLLRALAAAAPSKTLITSRLTPRVLLNSAGQEIPGVRRVPLSGLRPPDAEALFRFCGIKGSSHAIQTYLQAHCGCHPLTTGVLAGLVQNYLPDKGNFDAWAADSEYGGQLNLADLDLVQKRNHILKAAIRGLSDETRQLLSILALLSEGVDYPTLGALNPYLPPEPFKIEKPVKPEFLASWSSKQREQAEQGYRAELHRRMEYEQAMEQWRQSPERRKARRRLEDTVQDLLNRGLIQYDDLTKRYDLHPVVRGIAAGGLQPEEKDSYGQRVIDHFSAKAHNPYEEAVTLEDVRDGIQIVRTLLKMGRYQDAHNAFDVDLSYALLFNLEAHSEILSLLKPFFPAGWGIMPTVIADNDAAILASTVGIALATLGELTEALSAVNAGLANRLRAKHWGGVITRLGNASWISYSQNWLARVDRCVLLGLNLAKLVGDDDDKFITLLRRFSYLAEIGEWATAQSIWESIDSMGRNWPRNIYRPGDAECQLARLHFWQGDLSEEQLAHAERVTHEGKNRYMVRTLHVLRAEWHSQKNEWALAAESLQEAVGLARAIGKPDAEAETRLALARFHMGQLSNAQSEAEQLTQVREASHHALSELWLAIGDHEQAKNYAIKAYQLAWADGEPYVHRYRLNKARSILQQLGAEIPQLPVYDPAKSEKFPWEDDLAAAIEELRAEKAAESSVDSTTSQ